MSCFNFCIMSSESYLLKCVLITPVKRKGEEVTPKGILVCLNTTRLSLDMGPLISLSHKIRVKSRSDVFKPIFRKAFSRSPIIPNLWVLNLRRREHKFSRRTGPRYKS
uniref:Uncharacterized protein n=1 Tax=Cacopsylla melanoneura TaxID=428564 RepID=A0A8D8SS23_9HEMI